MIYRYSPSLGYSVVLIVFIISFLLINNGLDFQYLFNFNSYDIEEQVVEKQFIKPEIVRAIYLTASSAGNDEFRQNIITSMQGGRINSVVIDIKDYSGYILYNTNLSELRNINAVRESMPDVKKILADFHQANIYVIARQTVFQDPVLATARPDLAFKTLNGNIWYDHKGLAWLDPNQTEVWEYNLAISNELVELGFDEINFDYMRYPSDGDMANMKYNIPEGKTKTDIMKEFFAYLSTNLTGKINISIDTFGLILDNLDSGYDLNIGQRLVDTVDYFDYVCPMMYPSHYSLTYLGFANSAEHPGAVISYGLELTKEFMENKRAKLRPWLQAFNLRAVYTKELIDQQTMATENVTSTDGWLLWNARNYYPEYIF